MTQPSEIFAQPPARRLLIVTGPAGAGRSTCIRALEDMGYEAIDNLPLSLLPRLVDGDDMPGPLAVGLDSRTRGFGAFALLDMIEQMRDRHNVEVVLCFLDCAHDVLLRRFSETRRKHPLAPDLTPLQGIEAERDMMEPLRRRAGILIDTSDMTPHDLKAQIGNLFGLAGGASLSVSVQSFSYKKGAPRGLDMTLDCRFLRNPYWEPSLRALDGRDERVQSYVMEDARYAEFFDRLTGMIEFLLPACLAEGKSYFSVGLGCTGGKHRSVTLAERLTKQLESSGWHVSTRHREL